MDFNGVLLIYSIKSKYLKFINYLNKIMFKILMGHLDEIILPNF